MNHFLTKDVTISVKGLLGVDKNGDEIELNTSGTYDYGEDEVSFTYLETELTGLEGTVTTFTVTSDAVTISREGTVNMQMLFEEGRQNHFNYSTPYGSIMMSVDTQMIEGNFHEHGGFLEVSYVIDMQREVAFKTAFTVDIKEITSE